MLWVSNLPFHFAGLSEEAGSCLNWGGIRSRWNKQTHTGAEIARRAWALSHCRWGQLRRKEQKSPNCQCLFSVSESLPSWLSQSSVHAALLSSNQFRMHAFSALGLSSHGLCWNASLPTHGTLTSCQALCLVLYICYPILSSWYHHIGRTTTAGLHFTGEDTTAAWS